VVAAASEGGGRRRGDVGGGGQIEVCEALEAGEAGFADAPGPAPFGSGIDLGGEDLGQAGEVGRPGPRRRVRQTGGVGAHDRQAQFPGRGADRRFGGVVADLGHRAASSWP
jgi:hypothetical protein